MRQRDWKNAFVEFDEITLGPTYHLVIGMAGSSNAFNICKRLEIPDGIIERAEDLKKMSPLNNMEEVMAKLNAQSRELSKERTNLQNQMKEIGSLKDKLLEERINSMPNVKAYWLKQGKNPRTSNEISGFSLKSLLKI